MKTIYNPQEAMRFAAWLEEEGGQVIVSLQDLMKVWTDLNNRWDDPKYAAYLRTFDESMESLVRFREESGRYITYLRKKAAIVADYLG